MQKPPTSGQAMAGKQSEGRQHRQPVVGVVFPLDPDGSHDDQRPGGQQPSHAAGLGAEGEIGGAGEGEEADGEQEPVAPSADEKESRLVERAAGEGNPEPGVLSVPEEEHLDGVFEGARAPEEGGDQGKDEETAEKVGGEAVETRERAFLLGGHKRQNGQHEDDPERRLQQDGEGDRAAADEGESVASALLRANEGGDADDEGQGGEAVGLSGVPEAVSGDVPEEEEERSGDGRSRRKQAPADQPEADRGGEGPHQVADPGGEE